MKVTLKTFTNRLTALVLAVSVASGIAGAFASDVKADDIPSVTYSAHVQDIGWMSPVTNGEIAGTEGRSLRVEALKMNLTGSSYSGSIEYRTHIENIGWEGSWHKDGEESGTTGSALRIEALAVRLTGEIDEYYDVCYRTHVQNLGWTSWTRDGAKSGSEGYALRVEAVQIVLVPEGSALPSSEDSAVMTFVDDNTVSYSTHVQNIGWQASVKGRGISGTTGRSLRLEAIQISLGDLPVTGSIEYRTHIQDIGWETDWSSDGEMSGTEGRSLRLEAIQIRLTGEAAKYYDVCYRVHAQNLGWLDWTKNGESAGTEGMSFRLEAIQIIVCPKDLGPQTGGRAFVNMRLLYPQACAVLDRVGWNLPAAFNWCVMTYVRGETSPAKGTRYFANIGFTNHSGNCYVMAACFYEMAMALGYDAHQMTGVVPLRRGGMGPHSWVEIVMDGKIYVFDPDFQYESGRSGYQIYYKKPGTWMYSNYRRMN
ncbi:MAG: hypothetical protein K5745_01230 [Saccharofermentans sp.]|nr:hypothetical protein [Saccharofermentans sp.]